jgi:hypothetical protein
VDIPASYVALLHALTRGQVQFLVMGVAGVNFHASLSQTLFVTEDLDLLLPPDPANTVRAWQVCESLEFVLTSAGGRLEEPLDLELAERVVERRAAVRAIHPDGAKADLSYLMAGCGFAEAWEGRKSFMIEGAAVPVAALGAIVRSKRLAGRKKDQLFLVSHAEILRELLGAEEEER